MLLVEEAEKIEENKARGKYKVKGDEFFLQGHFPGNPIVPGVIQCEILAQSVCVLLADSLGEGRGTILQLHRLQYLPLSVGIQIGQFYTGR